MGPFVFNAPKEIARPIPMRKESPKYKRPMHTHGPFVFGVPKEIRTPVAAVKGQCPRPLDDGDG